MRRKDREITDTNEIKEILDMCKTCHVGMVDGCKPYVIPLSYGYELVDDELTLYFHSAKEGRKIDILSKNKEICFELCDEGDVLFAETPCNSGYYYSSIIGEGQVEFLENTQEKCHGLSVMFKHQSGTDVVFNQQQADTVAVFKVTTKVFSAKRKKKVNH